MGYTLHVGDNLAVLRTFADNSIDCIVTDPPYGLGREPDALAMLRDWLDTGHHAVGGSGFMGREWDAFVPQPELWRECLRVLKPGGHLLSFGGTRTYDLVVLGLRIAGFQIRDHLAWLYGQGFPKSLDVSKAIDKRKGDRDDVLAVTAWIREARDAAGLSNVQIDAHFGFVGMAGHWTTQQSQPEVPTAQQWPILLELLRADPPDDVAEIATRIIRDKGKPGDAWFAREITGAHEKAAAGQMWRGTFDGAAVNVGERRDNPATELAARAVGVGTALKPAIEPIVLCRKPPAGSIADTFERYGTGGLQIDDARIPFGDDEQIDFAKLQRQGVAPAVDFGASGLVGSEIPTFNAKGRWPSNVIADTEAGALIDAQTGAEVSRVFYNPKATTAEREAGLSHLPAFTAGELTDRDDGSAGLQSPRAGAGRTSEGRRNLHPTVKPIDLMRYLVALICPPGGIVLDPFAGSGTTGIGAILAGREFVGIELLPEHAPICEGRLAAAVRGEFRIDRESGRVKTARKRHAAQTGLDL